MRKFASSTNRARLTGCGVGFNPLYPFDGAMLGDRHVTEDFHTDMRVYLTQRRYSLAPSSFNMLVPSSFLVFSINFSCPRLRMCSYSNAFSNASFLLLNSILCIRLLQLFHLYCLFIVIVWIVVEFTPVI